MFKTRSFCLILVLLVILSLSVGSVAARGFSPSPSAAPSLNTAFTYQGQLKNGSGNPVNAICDFNFGLWNALSDGTQIGSTAAITGVAVNNGLFTVQLDFGVGSFPGATRWLETAVHCPGDTGFTTLTPRQELTPTPYALYALSAGNAGTVTNGVYTNGIYNDPAWITHLAGSKITGTVASATNADTVDGLHAADFQSKYARVIVVAKKGGDYDSIGHALDSITDAAADNPYLIYVAPGIYTESVTMKPYVDIEGAGEGMTRITHAGQGSTTGTVNIVHHTELRFLTVESTGGTIAIAIYALEISSVQILHVTAAASGASGDNYGILDDQSVLTLTSVNASASGGQTSYAISNSYSSPEMQDVSATASGGTIQNIGVFNSHDSSPTMTNVVASASGAENEGILNDDHSDPVMRNVTATASGGTSASGIYNTYSDPSMTDVSASANGGSITNGIYNYHSNPTMENTFASADAGSDNRGVNNFVSSPRMKNVTANASGGSNTYGVFNDHSSPVMRDVDSTVIGGTNIFGIYNYYSSPEMNGGSFSATATTLIGTQVCGVYNWMSPTPMTNINTSAIGGQSTCGVLNAGSDSVMTNVNATASDGYDNYGLWNESSSPKVSNCTITAGGGSDRNFGIFNTSMNALPYTPKIINSKIYGTGIGANTINTFTGTFTTYVGSSQLGGSAVSGSTYVCINVFNDNFTALNNTCHLP